MQNVLQKEMQSCVTDREWQCLIGSELLHLQDKDCMILIHTDMEMVHEDEIAGFKHLLGIIIPFCYACFTNVDVCCRIPGPWRREPSKSKYQNQQKHAILVYRF